MSGVARELANLTWNEADELFRERPVGLLPVGAIEAHGPHLPLDTDVIIAREIAGRAAVCWSTTAWSRWCCRR